MNNTYTPMVWIKVKKIGHSFTGGMYPLATAPSSVLKLQAQGFKVISVKQVA